MAVVTIPSGGDQTIQIDFDVSASAPTVFFSLFLEADPASGDTVGTSVDFSILPSSGNVDTFGIATVTVTPFAAEGDDLIFLDMTGFTPNEKPRIFLAGVEFCDGADDDDSDANASGNDAGFTGCTVDNLSDNTSFDANGSLNNFVIKVPNGPASGLYELTVEDETGIIGFTLFEILDAADDFNLNVSPPFIDPIKQNTSSAPISITTAAVAGKNPGTVNLKIFGLPPDINTTLGGIAVSDTQRTGAGFDVTVGIGVSETTPLVISPTTSAPPGPYFMTIEASTGNSFQFFDLPFEVIPGGTIDLSTFESLSITPDFGKPGDVISIKATGFNAGAAVSLKIAGLETATGGGGATFEADGSFSTSVKIPAGIPPGIYTVKISDGTNDATESIEILAPNLGFVLSVSPDYVNPVVQGDTTDPIQVTVTSPVGVDAAETTINVFGLPPDATVVFNPDNTLDPPLGGTATTIITIVTALTTPPGPYGLTIEANDGTTFSGLPFGISVSPVGNTSIGTLTLNPATISAGEDLTLSGSGFESGASFSSVKLEVPGSPTFSTIPNFGGSTTVDAKGEFNTLIEIPDGTIPGHYLVSVTAGSRTAEAELDIIPEDDEFFYIAFTPDFLNIVQNTVVTAGPTSSMIIQGSNGFGGVGDNLLLLVSDLPLGMSVRIETTAGTELVTYQGTLQGNSITNGGTPADLAGADRDDLLTGGTDILPGKQTTLLVKFGATANAPLGVSQIFIGAEEVDNNGDTIADPDFGGSPISVEVKATVNSPSLTISPTGGKVLGTATIIGEGFTTVANTPIIFKFGGNLVGENSFATAPTTITTDAAGKFTGYVTVPNLESGTYSITATDGTNSAGTSYQILSSTEDTFTLQVGPKKALIEANGSATQTVTLKPVGAFNSPVTISLIGLPAGITAAPLTKTITPTPGVSSTVSFTLTDGGAALGTTTYTVDAAGTTPKTASASLEVIGATDFTFSFGPGEVIVEAGGDPVIVNTKAITTSAAFVNPIAVSVSNLDNVTFDTTPITIDGTDLLGSGTITVTAGAAAISGDFIVTLTAEHTIPNVTKTPTLLVRVVAGATEEIINEGIDPSAISDLLPGVILPKYDDGQNPTYKFTSLTTDSLSNTVILTTKIDAPLTDLSTLLADENGVLLDEGVVTSFGTQIYNISVGDGVTELSIEVCLPVSSLGEGFIATSLLFFSIINNQWEQIPVTSNDGILICGDTDHLSSWAVGGVKALAVGGLGGGGGSAYAPSFTKPPPSFSFGAILDSDGNVIEVTKIEFDMLDFENEVETRIIETGEHVEFRFAMFENSGGENVQHFEFLINLTDKLTKYYNSDTYIIYDKEPSIFWSVENQQETDFTLTIKDPHGFFENVDFDIEPFGDYTAVVTLNITFAKAMAESDIYLRMWDVEKNSRDTILRDAIEVIGEDLGTILSEELIEEPTDVEETLNIPEWIKRNALWWGEGQINDDTFIQGIEFLIYKEIIDLPYDTNVSLTTEEKEKIKFDEEIIEPTAEIPSWIRNTAQWWAEGQLSDIEFVNGLKWLIQNEIILAP